MSGPVDMNEYSYIYLHHPYTNKEKSFFIPKKKKIFWKKLEATTFQPQGHDSNVKAAKRVKLAKNGKLTMNAYKC